MLNLLLNAVGDPEALLLMEPEDIGVLMLAQLTSNPQGAGVQNGMFHPDHSEMSLAYGGGAVVPLQHQQRQELDLALREAWAWLEAQALIVPASPPNGGNGWRVLSRRARRFNSPAAAKDFKVARQLPKDALHPSILRKAWVPYTRGEYDTAAFEAMRQVEISLRAAAGNPQKLTAVQVARSAFHTETGALTDHNAEPGERQAIGDLFAGALGTLKNPHSHREVQIEDAAEAASIVMFASYLLNVIDARAQRG